MAREDNDTSTRPEEGDAAGASSSGVIARRTTNVEAGVEVVAKNGRRVKLNGPIEVTWSHGEPFPPPNGAGFMCYYCHKKKRGGGVSRLREHLGGITGSVVECKLVPPHIKSIMSDQVAEGRIRRKRSTSLRLYVEKEVAAKRVCGTTTIPLDEEEQVEMAMRESLRDSNSTMQHENSSPFGKSICSTIRVASTSANHQTRIDRFYKGRQSASASKTPFDIDLARSRVQVQPRVDVMLEGVAKDQLGQAWAKWFQANDVPGRKADCPYFRSAVMLTQQFGEGVPIPRGKEIDGRYLDINFADMEAHMAEFKDDWKDYGVSIMCDSWTGPTMMSVINFMICCNGRMFFHKSVDATGLIQNADYILEILLKVVADEVGAKNVVQIVTDNGSNYKKACQQLIAIYPTITWQPCSAHTINLMLKDIARFPDVEEVVESAKRICRFLYNHNRLHAMMRERIGGELVRWNATRFGTVFIFLQSFWDRKDKFKQWMTTDEWENSPWAGTADHDFTYDCLTKKIWWRDMEVVLKAVSPIYSVLRLADQQKNVSISSFLPKMLNAMKEIRGNLSVDDIQKNLLDRLMGKVKTRLNYLLTDTLMFAAAALDPKALYTSKLARNPKAKHAVTLAIKKLARSSSKASAAIDQFTLFSKQGGLFGGQEAKKSALNGRCSAADWWDQYGGECSELQEVARRIVSQCMSSSGCERNWSTFALVHTKLRNRFVIEELGIDEEEVAAFRKKISGKRGKKRKERFEEEDIASDFESQSDSDQQHSPICAESEESSSDSSEGDDDGHDGRASAVASQLGDGGCGARDGDKQPTFLRPRSKRLKKRNLKNLY
ncbi:unnamed protein product [Urochloa humidicola]